MKEKWRLFDSGPKSAAENIAIDAALLEARAKNESQSSLRFLQFSPPSVLIGYHQTVEHEVRTGYCKKRGIDVGRRITGGGAIYFDPSQLGFEIIALRKEFGYRLDAITEKLTSGFTLGLGKLGIDAKFRPRNDIEVNGRKISGTGGVFEGDAFLFQGTLLVDFDVKEMIRALRVPVEKLAEHEISSAEERVTWISKELGCLPDLDQIKGAIEQGFAEALGIEFERKGLSDFEAVLIGQKLPYYNSTEWVDEIKEAIPLSRIVKSSFRAKAGLIRVQIVVDTTRRILRQALITGDFFVSPKQAIFNLEAALKDTPFDKAQEAIEAFFSKEENLAIDMFGLEPTDFILPIKEAIERADHTNLGFSLVEAGSLFAVNGDLKENLKSASVILLPYCAKLIECEYREKEGCIECGACTIGDAYRLARQSGLRPITIHNYEHLKGVLESCKEEGVKSYIGCCCEAFFNKRQRLFREAGMGGVLLDIDDVTCYDLDQEAQALKGDFKSQTSLKLPLLKKVIGVRGSG
ncbi:MAG: DUF116 domain-containing protein [Actinomycetota bacterium]|nr:DUF116 domain-containing protein [Actinomycetota bacterium]